MPSFYSEQNKFCFCVELIKKYDINTEKCKLFQKADFSVISIDFSGEM